MAVGRSSVSPRAIAGNSSGKPPACHTPRLTDSATRCRCTLHGANSDQGVAIPITGPPSNTSGVNPWLRIHSRLFMPERPVAPNHVALRLPGVWGPVVVMFHMYRPAGTRGKSGWRRTAVVSGIRSRVLRCFVPAESAVTPDPLLFRDPRQVEFGVEVGQGGGQPRPLLRVQPSAP